jgi:hypothetical protein
MSHPCNVCNYYPVPDGDGVPCPHCHRLQYGKVCPRCGQAAPTIIRGMTVHCSACDFERGPTGGLPLNLVGAPTRIGGTVARVVGVTALVLTLLLATVVGLFFGLFSVTSGAIAALVIAAIGATIGGLVLRGGRSLSKLGDTARQHAREQAIYALANNQRGMVTAADVARALNVQLSEADALLTAMAREGARVGVEVDGQGVVRYTFRDAVPPAGSAVPPASPVRVDVSDAAPSAPRDPAEVERERIRASVDREFEQMRLRK